MSYSTAYTFLHKFLAYRFSKGCARKLSTPKESAIANRTAFWRARISRTTFWRAICVSYLRYARKRLMNFDKLAYRILRDANFEEQTFFSKTGNLVGVTWCTFLKVRLILSSESISFFRKRDLRTRVD